MGKVQKEKYLFNKYRNLATELLDGAFSKFEREFDFLYGYIYTSYVSRGFRVYAVIDVRLRYDWPIHSYPRDYTYLDLVRNFVEQWDGNVPSCNLMYDCGYRTTDRRHSCSISGARIGDSIFGSIEELVSNVNNLVIPNAYIVNDAHSFCPMCGAIAVNGVEYNGNALCSYECKNVQVRYEKERQN